MLLSSRKPRSRKVHDLKLEVVHHLDGQFDAARIAKNIEKIVVDGVAHLVLGDVIGPDVDDVVSLDKINDGQRDDGNLIRLFSSN